MNSRKRNCRELLEAKWREGKFVCVGLDTDHTKLPKGMATDEIGTVLAGFNERIVEATSHLVCAYKLNSALYERHRSKGMNALRRSISYIHETAADVPVILDAKRGDIGNTNYGYVSAAFEWLGADAITVHPYLGKEALRPFLDCEDKSIFVLCRTSNPGAGEFQDLRSYGESLYQIVARHVAETWNDKGNCGLVVGATYPGELQEVRRVADDLPLLIPGIGAQGGDLEKTVAAGADSRGRGMIINSSRGIIFAHQREEYDGVDFAEAAWRETEKLHHQITSALDR